MDVLPIACNCWSHPDTLPEYVFQRAVELEKNAICLKPKLWLFARSDFGGLCQHLVVPDVAKYWLQDADAVAGKAGSACPLPECGARYS